MFYLNNFFKSFFHFPVRGVIFILATVLFVGSAFVTTKVERSLLKGVAKMEKGASFFALIDSKENNSRVARKLRELPGVEKVKVLSKADVSSSLDELLKTLNVGVSRDLIDLSFSGLQIEFHKGLPQRSQNLIRDYLTRLVGADKLTMGAVNRESQDLKDKRGSFAVMIRTYLGPILTAFAGVFWFVLFIIFRKDFIRSSYLSEQFQRRSNVPAKTLAAGFALLFFGTAAAMYLLAGIPQISQILFVFTTMFMILVVHVRRIEWEA
jgi:hypothetical protein